MRPIGAIPDKLLSLVNPTWPGVTSVFSQNLSEQLIFAARTTLRHNLTSILEARFRAELFETLKEWALASDANYENTKQKLDRILSNRNPILARLIPSEGISKCLMSFGFFSSSFQVTTKQSWQSLYFDKIVLRTSLFFRNFGPKGQAILRSLDATRRGFDAPLEREVLEYIGALPSVTSESRGSTGRALIIGPGVWDEEVNPEDYDLVIVLVTLNKDLRILEHQVAKFSATLYLNGDSTMKLIENPSGQLQKIAIKSRGLYGTATIHGTSAGDFSIPVHSNYSKLMNLWDWGNPNLMPRAVGTAISRGLVCDIVGADLYAGRLTYGASTGQFSGDGSQNSRPKFFTCAALASHDPLQGFLILRRLERSGLIAGKARIQEILSLTPYEYLAKLDVSLGSKRG